MHFSTQSLTLAVHPDAQVPAGNHAWAQEMDQLVPEHFSLIDRIVWCQLNASRPCMPGYDTLTHAGNHAWAREMDQLVPDHFSLINDQDAVPRSGKFVTLFKRAGERCCTLACLSTPCVHPACTGFKSCQQTQAVTQASESA